MLVSLRWIRELLPALKAKPDAVAARLTSAGIEVEAITRQADALDGVITAEVIAVAPHPGADKLKLATVFDGSREQVVVCGAPNVAQGQKVAFAPLSTRLPNGMTIERREIRGVASEGMICSADELGLAEGRADGILVLEKRTKPGRAIAEILGLTDVIYELSITPNRADALSHLGIARELAALFGLPHPKVATKVKDAKRAASQLASVEVSDDARCPKYAGRVIGGVKVGPSPSWVVDRLRAVGVRSISNVVDATNLVLMELGHPLHAFDLAKLEGGRIVVRTAAEKETLTLLDGKVLELSSEDLVIADAERPVALAGVMGGATSEVSAETTSILLESALFDPTAVRRTAKRYGLHTEASHRFERGADPEMVELALDRCAVLIAELSDALGAETRVFSGRLRAGRGAGDRKVVPIRPDRASLVIGRKVGRSEIKRALESLGLDAVKPPKKRIEDALYFRVPSYRVDLAREEDLIEEVARLGGYDQIPTLMPPGSSAVWTEGPRPDREGEVRDILVAEGFFEAISLAFHSRAAAEALGLDVASAVRVANPLGEKSELMRLSMVPALLDAARANQDNLPRIEDVRLFEIGKTFQWTAPPHDLPREMRRVGMLVRGRRAPRDWTGRRDAADPYDLLAAIEAVLDHFHIERTLEAHDVPWLHPRSSTRIQCEGRTLGVFGEAHPAVMELYGFEGSTVVLGELELDAVVRSIADRPATFRPLAKLPPAQRDLSFFIDRDVTAARVLAAIRAAGRGRDLESAEIFDLYDGKGVPEGKKSLAVGLVFRSDARTLTDQDVEASQAHIVRALEALGAQVRDARPA
jgi:phenylalanyl-tRNA synthetase beta chain